MQKEMGINCSKIVFLLFNLYHLDDVVALDFNSRLRLNEGLLNHAGHIGYSIRPSGGVATLKSPSDKVYKLPRKRIS